MDDKGMELIQFSRSGTIGWLTLADPARRNAISPELTESMARLLAGIERDRDIDALVVTGAGSAFCAGASRQTLASADEEAMRGIYSAFLALRDLSIPTVA